MKAKAYEVEIRLIEHGSEDYKASLDLRHKELREPIGLNLFDEDLSRDKNEMHIGAFSKNDLVGILILVPGQESKIQMRQVAVVKALQGKGIGNQLVGFAEDYCIENGFEEIYLHARKSAMEFYENMAYEVEGDSYLEVGIPHFNMYKRVRHTPKQNKLWKFVYIFAIALLIDNIIIFVGRLISSVSQLILNTNIAIESMTSNLYNLIPIVLLILIVTYSKKKYTDRLDFSKAAFYIGIYFAVRTALGLLNIPVYISAIESLTSMDHYSSQYMLIPIVNLAVSIISTLIRAVLAILFIRRYK